MYQGLLRKLLQTWYSFLKFLKKKGWRLLQPYKFYSWTNLSNSVKDWQWYSIMFKIFNSAW